MTIVLDARTATPHFPGIGRYVVNLARGLPAIAPELNLTLLSDALAREALPLPDLPRDVCAASPFSLRQQWVVPRVLRASHATLYHSPYYLMPYLPGVPTVLTCYDLIPLIYPAYFTASQRLIFQLTHWLALRTARVTLAISETTRADLIHFFKMDSRRIRVIPLAADARFAPCARATVAALRDKYDLPENYVLYVGSNKPHKNLPFLVRAFAQSQLAQPSAQITLVIAGVWDARYPESRQVAQERSAPIRFLGPVDDADLPALYSGAMLFVFPSEYEGFGLPPLEAMACGVPVVCSRIPSLLQLVGDAALLFDPHSINALIQVLEHAWQACAVREQLRARGLARAAEFSWERTARATLQVYRDLSQ